jgi:methylated-DNA-[protein]-cysteine S-methyltransferase
VYLQVVYLPHLNNDQQMKKQQGSELFSAIVAAPFGAMGVRAQDGQLRELVYLPPHFAEKAAQDAVSERACVQLARYFRDPDHVFDLPLAELGSAYQQRVWAAIAGIPRGRVHTYGDVARQLGAARRRPGLRRQLVSCGHTLPPGHGRWRPGRLCPPRRRDGIPSGREALAAGA